MVILCEVPQGSPGLPRIAAIGHPGRVDCDQVGKVTLQLGNGSCPLFRRLTNRVDEDQKPSNSIF